MDIDQLRRAASKLRQYAGHASIAGPAWKLGPNTDDASYESFVYATGNSHHAGVADIVEGTDAGHYIALMHPPVALALADWLDLQAQAEEGRVEQEKVMRCQPGALITHRDEMAYALARAVLREDGS